jgi:hypothetical protein
MVMSECLEELIWTKEVLLPISIYVTCQSVTIPVLFLCYSQLTLVTRSQLPLYQLKGTISSMISLGSLGCSAALVTAVVYEQASR